MAFCLVVFIFYKTWHCRVVALALMLSSERTRAAVSSSFATSIMRIRRVHFGQTVISTSNTHPNVHGFQCGLPPDPPIGQSSTEGRSARAPRRFQRQRESSCALRKSSQYIRQCRFLRALWNDNANSAHFDRQRIHGWRTRLDAIAMRGGESLVRRSWMTTNTGLSEYTPWLAVLSRCPHRVDVRCLGFPVILELS